MAVENLNFLGINRAITDYASTSACEELINLRPTGTGLIPVKPFAVKMARPAYHKIFVHKVGSGTNYIATMDVNDETRIVRISEDGHSVLQLLSVIPYVSPQSIRFATVGNYVLFSIKDEDEGVYTNLAFLWDGSEYDSKQANVPDINIGYEFSTAELLVSPVAPAWDRDTAVSEIKDQIDKGLRAIEEENKEYCMGPVIVAIAFKTTDGKTFWTNRWLICDPFPVPPEGNVPSGDLFPDGYVLDENSGIAKYFPTFFNTHKYGLYVAQKYTEARGRAIIGAAGRKLTLTLSMGATAWNEQTSLLQSVEIYASRPANHVDPLNAWGERGQAPGGVQYQDVVLPQVQYNQMELEKQLLYFQKSIPLEELSGTTKQIVLQFGGNIQTTNKTLETDAGAVTRFGDILSYNARFHYFNSVARVRVDMPEFVYDETYQTVETDVFVVYNDGMKDIPIFCGTKMLPDIHDHYASLVISPMMNVRQVITQQPAADPSGTSRVYPMTASPRYNYSICTDGASSKRYRIAMYTRLDVDYYSTLIKEPSAINVTEQYNPFVFKVEHSYMAPGRVLDVQPQMVAVKDVTLGDYPLNVFTDRGLYALLQGNGVVLYGNFRSISNLITTSNSIPTENGTFFIAAGDLWLIAGDNAVLVSEALNPGPHKFIRSGAGYHALCNGNYYNVDSLQSEPIFSVYVNGAVLSYNRYRDELIVSNPNFEYSYVLSIKHRQWFKIGMTLSQDNAGSDIAWSDGSIVDFSNEMNGENRQILVHLQSRPFSFSGYMYSHIHRVISMVRTALSLDDILIVSVYGSDDLQDWVLLSYAGRASEVHGQRMKISQVRTPPAARSWRYYTICIGGNVPLDTDFGPVLVDYQPVIRRLG